MCHPTLLSQCLTWPSPDLSFGTESSLLLGKMLSLLYDCQEPCKTCPLDGHINCVLSAQGSISNRPALLVTSAHRQELLLESARFSHLLCQGGPSRSQCSQKKNRLCCIIKRLPHLFFFFFPVICSANLNGNYILESTEC